MGLPGGDRTVLRAIVEAAESGYKRIDVDELVDRTGLDRGSVRRSLRRLSADGDQLFRSELTMEGEVLAVHSVTIRARQVVLSSDPLARRSQKGLLRTVGNAAGGIALAMAAKVVAAVVIDHAHR